MRRCRSTAAVCGGAALAILGAVAPSQASSLVYTPINPSFGGNPQNGPVLLDEANAQNLPLAKQTAEQAAVAAAKAAANGTGTLTASQIFAEELQSQLLSSFANQITQAIFKSNAVTGGSAQYQNTLVTWSAPVNGEITITITADGSSTTIVVPVTTQ